MSTLNEVIKKLQEMKKKYGGDIKVFVFSEGEDEGDADVTKFTVEEQDDWSPKRIVIQ